MNTKTRKTLEKTLKTYGLTLEHGTKHYAVLTSDGKRAATISGTGESNALRQAMRDLRKGGHVDDDACRIKF